MIVTGTGNFSTGDGQEGAYRNLPVLALGTHRDRIQS